MRKRKSEELKETNLIYGMIPSSWGLSRIEHVSDYTKHIINTNSFEDINVIHYSIPNIQEFNKGRLEKGKEINSSKFILKGDEILISKLNPRKKTIVEATPNDAYKLICSTEFLPLRVKSIERDYFYYTLLSTDVTDFICARVQSVTRSHQRANPSDITKLLITIPPKSEQKAIATFLDRKTQAIDGLIEKKQQLIEKLKEKRQAMITRAVTKGLDPDVPMKDSGIEWLGEIPEHWEVQKTKYLFRMVTDKAPINNDYELLSVYTDIGVKPRKDLEAKGNKASTTDGYWIVHKGDIIVNKLLAWMGAIGYSNYEGVTSPAYDILCPKKGVQSRFYGYLFRTKKCQSVLKRHSYGIMDMRLRLYFNQFGQIYMPLPPENEQKNIVEFISNLQSRTIDLINKTEKSVQKLKEYRQSLISAAVTGKIDVQDEVGTVNQEVV